MIMVKENLTSIGIVLNSATTLQVTSVFFALTLLFKFHLNWDTALIGDRV